MAITLDPLDTEVVAAMYAVAVDGMPATDAWLDYVRRRYPAAVDELAKVAMTEVALDLLVANGDMTRQDAVRQRREAAAEAARKLRGTAWEEIHEVKQTLTMLERISPNVDGEVVEVVDEAAPTLRAAPST